MKKLDRTWRSQWMRMVVSLRNSPEAIALGTAVGVFVAFTPTVGFQMLIGAVIATFIKANRPAAIIATWIANPLTLAPVFALTFRVGRAIAGLPSAGAEYERFVGIVQSATPRTLIGSWGFLKEIAGLGATLMTSLWIGGAVLGIAFAGAAYPVVLWTGRRFRTYREIRRQKRAARLGTPSNGMD